MTTPHPTPITGTIQWTAAPPEPQTTPPTEHPPQDPRTTRRPPVNVRMRPSTAPRFQAAYLDAKAKDLDLSLVDFASDLIEEALAARQRQR